MARLVGVRGAARRSLGSNNPAGRMAPDHPIRAQPISTTAGRFSFAAIGPRSPRHDPGCPGPGPSTPQAAERRRSGRPLPAVLQTSEPPLTVLETLLNAHARILGP